jgi:hypothetical protein
MARAADPFLGPREAPGSQREVGQMPEPVVFLSHFKVKEGKIDELKRLAGAVERSLREGKPRTAAWLVYLDEDQTKVTFVHCFPDAGSMDLHFEGSDERTAAVYEFVEPDGFEIYGRPSEQALETMQQAAAGSGVSLRVLPEHVGGFLRTQPA